MSNKIGTLALTGKSGKKYEFNVYPRETEFKAIGAVYYVSKRTEKQDGTGTHDAVYIGQTDDMSQRFTSHNEEACFVKHGANCISVYRNDNAAPRLAMEKDLIESYTPPCNS